MSGKVRSVVDHDVRRPTQDVQSTVEISSVGLVATDQVTREPRSTSLSFTSNPDDSGAAKSSRQTWSDPPGRRDS